MSNYLGEILVISKPVTRTNRIEKHYVVRAKDPKDEGSALLVGSSLMYVDIQAIANTYEEAVTIINNIGG